MLRNDAILAGFIKPTAEEAKLFKVKPKNEAEIKKQLAEYAKERFGVKLNLGKTLQALTKQVDGLEAKAK